MIGTFLKHDRSFSSCCPPRLLLVGLAWRRSFGREIPCGFWSTSSNEEALGDSHFANNPSSTCRIWFRCVPSQRILPQRSHLMKRALVEKM